MKSERSGLTYLLLAIIGGLAALACGLFIVILGLGWLIVDRQSTVVDEPEATVVQVTAPPPTASMTAAKATPRLETPTAVSLKPTPSATPRTTATPVPASSYDLQPNGNIDQRPIPPVALTSLATLMGANYPAHDYHETAARLGARDVGPRTVTRLPYSLGDRQTFQVEDRDIEATLAAATEHVYFWVEQGVSYDPAALTAAARRFENDYYPRIVSLFGQEWQPGMDGDPHFSVLHLKEFSEGDELGYFISSDEYPRSIDSRSNEQELVYLNMSYLEVGEPLYYGTLIHELQHLIQWYVDPNEATWADEGLAQLAELYVGLDTAGTADYLRQTNTQLNSWNYDDDDAVYAHYAAAYLFHVYFWEQLGETAVQELARHPGNGMAAIQSVLRGYRPDSTLETFLANWATATYLDDPAAGPAYHYQNLDLRRPSLTANVDRLPFDYNDEVVPFGVHYINLDLSGETTISFVGDTLTELVSTTAHSGEQMWLAPGQDNLDAHLTASFDLSRLKTATLSFRTWYETEEDWDFAYVVVSTDGGTTWEFLQPHHATTGDFGPAFSGQSRDVRGSVNGWLAESISLNSYVGQEILVRFEFLTDASISSGGFAVDDIAIPELGYATDVETVDGVWEADGFVVSGSELPQRWSVQLIERTDPPQVTEMTLDSFNQGQWTLELDSHGGVLVITALTPFVNEPANYWLRVER